jgi:hypothetical protein
MAVADPVKKPDTSRTEAQRPPPLPSTPARTPAAARGGALARAKAFVTIRRMRMADRFRRLGGWFRRRPILSASIGAAVVLAAAAGAYVAVEGFPEVDVELFTPMTLADARAAVRARPDDAGAHRALGHVLWSKGKRHASVLSYGRALGLDRGAATSRAPRGRPARPRACSSR